MATFTSTGTTPAVADMNSYRNAAAPANTVHNNTSPGNHAVNFHTPTKRDEVHEQKQKYFTAKYGAQQMVLIRKRLKVEDWVDDQLRDLYDCEDDADTYDCEIDLDEVLDLDTDNEKRQFIWEKVSNAPQSQEVLSKFIEELLERTKTL
ncbi:protein phosphatase 1 regulatory subunit 14C-like [Lingula anatina]|uniref:Protein phosphatase 1 regulatory subunit 14C-like n=1 Tax=Lingula anatina TaxID=7574 RepID=A0A1S3ING2_LINAN|nr:protein phosphatase 1 regulatory subunit 14C-like [Lingula anatina]XP_013414085.1 protein phosphatase 1 regulatory subunit 14C-like [Lingula anatina]|eukprot:XP_013399742.1 protein phosphatase 1 regulatory subunit 14C-like [Lingula anatina]